METMKDINDIPTEEAEKIIRCVTPHYRMVRSLGSGSYGKVFLVEDDQKQVTAKLVALEFRPGAPVGPDIQTKLTNNREWRLIQENLDLLRHPSMVQIRDYFVHHVADSSSSIAVYGVVYRDYWPRTLRSCVRRLVADGKYPRKLQFNLLTSLAQLFIRLREDTGALYTDIATSNIMVKDWTSDTPTLAFGDFGGLHSLRRAEAGLRCDYTKDYIAPELHDRDPKKMDEQALVYGFGLMAFFILEGRHPYQEFKQPGPIFPLLIERGGPDWTAATCAEMAGVMGIIDRCLQSDRAVRYPDFSSVRNALEQQFQISKVDPENRTAA